MAILLLGETMPQPGWCEGAKAEFSLRYAGEPGCPNEAAFIREIATRTSRALRTEAAAANPRFDIDLRIEGDAAAGSLTLHQADGSSSLRTVRAPTCSEVAAALALVIALTIDPSATINHAPGSTPLPQSPESLPPPENAPQPTAPKPRRTSDAARAPSATRRTNKKESPAPSKALATPASMPEAMKPTVRQPELDGAPAPGPQNPTRKDSEAGPPVMPAMTTPPLHLPPPPSKRKSWTASAGAALASQKALAPWWMIGAAIQVSGSHSSGWTGRASIGIFPLSRGNVEGATAAFGLWALRGDVCYDAPRAERPYLLGCAAIEAGRVTATGAPGGRILTGVTGSSTWLAMVGIVGIALPIGPLTIDGQGEVIAPMLRDHFGIRTGPEFSSVHQPSRFGLGARIGLRYRFSK